MAKYTILFKDYMDVGSLPASIDTIEDVLPGFTQAFIARNKYKEIGAETIEAFENRLDAVALRIYPSIKARLDVKDAAVNGRNRSETTKTTKEGRNSQTRQGQTDGTFDKGNIDTVQRNVAHAPITTVLNNEDVIDGSINTVSSGTDTTHATNSERTEGSNTDTTTTTHEYTENNVDTSIAWAELNERFNGIFEETLRAFDCCFLGVW